MVAGHYFGFNCFGGFFIFACEEGYRLLFQKEGRILQ